MKSGKPHQLLLLSLSLTLPAAAADRVIDMQGTAIIGNQELPKVLSIVPWKKSRLPDMNQPAMHSFIDEALAPVDRDTFKREIYYYNHIKTTTTGKE